MRNSLSSWGTWRAVIALGATLLALGTPARAAAQAGEDEVFVTLGAEYSSRPDFTADSRGIGGSLAAFWGMHRWFALGAHGGYAHHFALVDGDRDDEDDVLSAFGGASFTVDVLEVVPFISLMPGAFFDDAGTTFAVRGALGVDYRPARNWALGADIAWHGLARDGFTFPGYSVFRLRVSYVLDLRGP